MQKVFLLRGNKPIALLASEACFAVLTTLLMNLSSQPLRLFSFLL